MKSGQSTVTYLLVLFLALALLLNAGSQFASARATTPNPSEVVTASGLTVPLEATQSITIPWPVFADGTTAQPPDCVGMVTAHQNPGTAHILELANDPDGFRISVPSGLAGRSVDFYYMILCTRDATATVAIEASTWGEVKSLYRQP